MILVDTNLLLYAINADAVQHHRAARWLNEQFVDTSRIGLPWHSLLGFVRLASNRQMHPASMTVEAAWAVVLGWLGAANVWIPQPTTRHAEVLDALIASTNVGSRAVMDVHLAALAIEHDLTLCSADHGFARYPKLRWTNPLAD